MDEKLEKIKEKVVSQSSSLYLKRIPKATKTEFLKLAKDEFVDDYGMTLKWLMDFRKGLLTDPNQILVDQIEVLSQQVAELKNVPQEIKKEKRIIRSVSGKVISEKEE